MHLKCARRLKDFPSLKSNNVLHANTDILFLPLVCKLVQMEWENLFLKPRVKASHKEV